MLKDQVEMPKVIVTDYDIGLMNSVAKVFHNSYIRLCRYHITKNVRSQVKLAVDTNHIELRDGKMVKAGEVMEKVMDAGNHIVIFSIK